MRSDSLRTGGIFGGGALGTALVLATGCLGTKVLLLLGVSSGVLSGLSTLEPYRPGLLARGVVALAFAGWRFYRRRVSGTPTPNVRAEGL